jgi:hypothetical protein
MRRPAGTVPGLVAVAAAVAAARTVLAGEVVW